MKSTGSCRRSSYGEMLLAHPGGRLDRADADRIALVLPADGEGEAVPILCRKPALDAAEQVILDLNALAAGKKFLGLGGWEVSDDGTQLAYTTDETGFPPIRPARPRLAQRLRWAGERSRGWTRSHGPATARSSSMCGGRAGRTAVPALAARGRLSAKDDLVYEEKDHAFNLEVDRSRSKDFIFLTSGSLTSSEVRFFRRQRPARAPAVGAAPRARARVLRRRARATPSTSAPIQGPELPLITAPVSHRARRTGRRWCRTARTSCCRRWTSSAIFVALHEREGGLPQIAFFDPAPSRGGACNSRGGLRSLSDRNRSTSRRSSRGLPEPVTRRAGSTWTRLPRPEAVKRQPVPNYDPSRYQVERIWACRRRREVPVRCSTRGRAARRQSPLLLYGYGSYGIDVADRSTPTCFRWSIGGQLCGRPHPRRGELGKKWHDQGRMMNKMNTFTDFISPPSTWSRWATLRGSPGGSWAAAPAAVDGGGHQPAARPVPRGHHLRPLRRRDQHHVDESLLSRSSSSRSGATRRADEYRYMKQYSPYDNVTARAYPTMLVAPRTIIPRSCIGNRKVRGEAPLAEDLFEPAAVSRSTWIRPATAAPPAVRRLKDAAYDYAFVIQALRPG